MYTNGIMKIFFNRNGGTNFSIICSMAEVAGFKALSFQNVIHVKTEDEGWVSTCFQLTDFQDVQT